MRHRIFWPTAAAYVAVVWLANVAVAKWGVRPVWPGYSAPVAVYFVAAALIIRDSSNGRWVAAPAPHRKLGWSR